MTLIFIAAVRNIMRSIEKSKQRNQEEKEKIRKPILIKYRSSSIYVMITVCFSIAANVNVFLSFINIKFIYCHGC